jgi:nucleotide-binding universal stress UspA family protein
MALKIIVSYDDSDNDRDALALGRLLAFSGAELSLAYVRHSFGESLDQHAAEELLARGADSVGTPDMPKYVVINPATSVGLAEVAEQEHADVIVFGSEYRTANGLVKPGISAHKLLLGGGSAIDPAARSTADSLAAALGATVAEHGSGPLDFLVVGSRKEAPEGKVVLSAASDYAVEAANYPVLVIPRGTALNFAGAPAASATNSAPTA